MYTFILSFIIVGIISKCFFKKNFWENRYIVLLIGSIVALVATITINMITRNDLPKYGVIVKNYKIKSFYMPDTILNDTSNKKGIVLLNYELQEIKSYGKDTAKMQTKVNFIIFKKKNNATAYVLLNNKIYDIKSIYIDSTKSNDPYLTKMKIVYKSNNKWSNDLGIPRLKNVLILNLPKKDFLTVPDTLINKLAVL